MADLRTFTSAAAAAKHIVTLDSGGGLEDGHGNKVFYEEGTWTPTLTGASDAGEYTLDVRLASYVRIGRRYEVHLDIVVIDIVTAGSGLAQIKGLPANKAEGEIFIAPVRLENVTFSPDTIYVITRNRFTGVSDNIIFGEIRDNDTTSNIPISAVSQGSRFIFNLSYFS